MKNREISRQLESLQALISKTNVACNGDVEMQSHWAKYICVLSAGLLENAVEHIFGEFCKNAASEPVARYLRAELARIQNPKHTRFVGILAGFKAQWGKDLEEFCDMDSRGDAINSIMTNRHLIAHGGRSDITLARVKDYLARSIEVLERIEEILGL